MSKLNDNIIIENNNSTIQFINNATYQTRTGLEVKEYEITAKINDSNTILSNNFIIEELNDGILFQHFTEQMEPIATIRCDYNLNIVEMDIHEIEETRSLRGWWVCTQIEYHKTKEDLEAKDNMILDVCSDWIPIATINAVLSDLYCMGIA